MREQVLGAGLVAPTLRSLGDFPVYRPTTLAEADEALRKEADLVVAAGCSDLVAGIREGLAIPALMSVRRIAELSEISHRDGVLRIGSAVTHHAGASSAEIGRVLPDLSRAWAQIATVRIRFTGTIGGNLLARRYRYEMPIMLGALNARLIFREETAESVDWLWTGNPGNEHRLLERIDIATEGLEFFGYERSMRPMTTVAVAVRRAHTGLEVTAAIGSEYRPTYIVQTTGQWRDLAELPVEEVAEELARQLPAEAADYTGGHRYRQHVVGVLIRRLLAGHLNTTAERTSA